MSGWASGANHKAALLTSRASYTSFGAVAADDGTQYYAYTACTLTDTNSLANDPSGTWTTYAAPSANQTWVPAG